jgi:hypothetical protein
MKRVDELVADHVVRVGERTRQREDDPPAQRLGDATGPLPHLARDDVVLLEIDRRRVEHQGLAAAELMLEEPRQPRVPALRHPRGDLRAPFLARVEVDVEVLRLEHLEIEMVILNLVLAEILRLGRRGGADHEAGGRAERRQTRPESTVHGRFPREPFCRGPDATSRPPDL